MIKASSRKCSFNKALMEVAKTKSQEKKLNESIELVMQQLPKIMTDKRFIDAVVASNKPIIDEMQKMTRVLDGIKEAIVDTSDDHGRYHVVVNSEGDR